MKYNSKQLQIIDVAEKQFSEKGFSGTSIRDISQEADINVSMISYYFGSKEKLIEALFTVRSEAFINRVEELMINLDLSPIQKVNLMIDGIIDRLIATRCFHNIVLREQLSCNHRTPIISELLEGLKFNNLKAMQKLISEGQQKGTFRNDVDVFMLSTALFGTINQALSTQAFYKKFHDLHSLPQQDLENSLKEKLSKHLRKLFRVNLMEELNDAESS